MKKASGPSEGFRSLGLSPWVKSWQKLVAWDEKLHLKLLPASLAIVGIFFLLIQGNSDKTSVLVFSEGDVAKVTVRSPQDIEIEDFEANQLARENYLSKIPLVYDFDPSSFAAWNEKWKSSVQSFRISAGVGSRVAKSLIEQKLGISLTESEFLSLLTLASTRDFERVSSLAFSSLWRQKIIESRNVTLGPGGVELVSINSGRTVEISAQDFMDFLTVESARIRVAQVFQKNSAGRGNMSFPWHRWKSVDFQNVKAVLVKMVQANVTFNRKESEARRAQALGGVKPLVARLAKDEVIVREGDRVTKKQEQVLKQLNLKLRGSEKPMGRTWEWIYGSLVMWMVLIYLARHFPKLLRNGRDALLMATLLLLSVAVLKISVVFGYDVLAAHFVNLPKVAFVFLIPVVTPAMVVRLLLGKTQAIFFSVLFAVASIYVFDDSLAFGMLTFSNALVGIMVIAFCRTRTDFYWAGLVTAVWCALGSVFIYKICFQTLPAEYSLGGEFRVMGWIAAGGFLGGLQSGILALVIVPIVESILDYTTDLKLLELARMDHPLLKDLVMKAPGTYHHSIVVGSLVEAGAEAIGANALLARVGSYYHDIGKIGRAEYFVENQSSGTNPHDSMKPQLSAKMIISHVKEGVELAKKHGLGQSMIDFIEQHHGKSLVHYFYNKAKQEAAQPGSAVSVDEIFEEDFRYPGPNPQTKETAIMALADKCEAATRSLVDPTPARVAAIVHKIIMKALEEGMLTDADITLRELHLVENAFLRILLGIYHSRVQYPDQEKGLPKNSALSLVSGGNK